MSEIIVVVKTKKYTKIILMAAMIILGVIGSMLNLSCKANPPSVIPPAPIPPSTASPDEVPSPHKLFPAYSIDIKYPGEEGFVTVKRGDAFTLGVTFRSLADSPIKIRPVLEAPPGGLPEYVKYQQQEKFDILNPGESISKNMTIKITENAPPGDYNLRIKGDLLEPVEGLGGESMGFFLTVLNNYSQGDYDVND
jgi:hypothetical protein